MACEDKVSVLTSKRWILSYLGMVGFVFVYATRVDMSVAIVCMVKYAPDNVTTSYSHDNSTIHAEEEQSCLKSTGSRYSEHGELEWDKATQTRVLASFFYGYIVTQIPGGWLASRYGGKRIWGTGMLLVTLCTFLIPILSRTNVNLVIALRVLMGLVTGVSFPSMHSIWSRWAPVMERTRLMTLCYAGPYLGNIATLIISGLLCAYGFDNGWGSIFYVTGLCCMVWVGLWFWLAHDSPQEHPTISAEERAYIESSLPACPDRKNFSVPWRSLFSSTAVWAIICAHFCNNWTWYTLLTTLPLYMKEVLKYDIKQNGAMSAIPYMCALTMAVTMGHLADHIRTKGYLSTKNTRKLFQSVGFFTTATCMLLIGYITCERRGAGVALLSFAVGTMAFGRAAYSVNHLDIAPRYAGVLIGITNTCATIPGMVAPLVVGALTGNKTREEWQIVFYICTGVACFGGVFYMIFAEGEVQPWAQDPEDVVKSQEYEPVKLHTYDTSNMTVDIVRGDPGASLPLTESNGVGKDAV